MRTKHQLIIDSKHDPLARQLLAIDDNPSYIPVETKKFLLMEYDSTCAICKRKTNDPHIDHIEPVSLGGKDYYENLQVLCRFCNLSKSAHRLDPKSYNVGYVIPIYVPSERLINNKVLERVLDEHF